MAAPSDTAARQATMTMTMTPAVGIPMVVRMSRIWKVEGVSRSNGVLYGSEWVNCAVST